jgi:hypothetical protein
MRPPWAKNHDTGRTTLQVLESHLAYREAGDVDGDLATNYASDVVLLSAEGIDHGHSGVRQASALLLSAVPCFQLSCLNEREKLVSYLDRRDLASERGFGPCIEHHPDPISMSDLPSGDRRRGEQSSFRDQL